MTIKFPTHFSTIKMIISQYTAKFIIIKTKINMRKFCVFISIVTMATLFSSCATIVAGGDPSITISSSSVFEPVTITTEKQTYPNVTLPAVVQVTGTAASTTSVWPVAGSVSCLTNTWPQPGQCEPSVRPKASQVTATAKSVTVV